DGVQVNGGHRNYIGANTFTNNALGLSLSGSGNVIEGNTIFGNAVGVAVRPATAMTVARITRNSIHGNGLAIERCWSGGSCDPKLRKGGIVFGVPSGEHASYVGKRGGGVTVDPAKLAKICPDGAPACQGAPNGGIAAPVLDSARQSGMRLTLEGHLDAAPLARFIGEVFANSRQAGPEGETFLGEVVTTTDAGGHGRFTFIIESVPGGTPTTYTATVTSSDGATSEFSAPIALSR